MAPDQRFGAFFIKGERRRDGNKRMTKSKRDNGEQQKTGRGINYLNETTERQMIENSRLG